MPSELLQSHQLKATKQRRELLLLMQREHRPRTAEQLQTKLKDVSLATVYRMMDDFLQAGLVNRVDLGHGHTHFEYADPKHHHHHLICDDCGRIEDVRVPNETKIVLSVGRKAKFRVRRHALEFFGLCSRCQTA